MTDEPEKRSDELARFSGNRNVYIREHIILAVLGAVLMTGLLVMIDNPNPWLGVVGAFAGIAARGFYVASEQLGFVWILTDKKIISPNERAIPLTEVADVRGIFSAVQVVTTQGDKFLIKYQPDRAGVIKTILNARDRTGG